MQPSPPPQPAAQTEEEKKAERLAKLEAWKKKQAEEKERKQRELQGAAGARSLLDEIDKRAAGSSAAPASQPSQPSPSTPEPDAEESSTPYAGKFDPKAIAKKAALASAASSATLGKDIALPGLAKSSATLTPLGASMKADQNPVAGSKSSIGTSNPAWAP